MGRSREAKSKGSKVQAGPLWPEPSPLSGRPEKPLHAFHQNRKGTEQASEPNSRREEGSMGQDLHDLGLSSGLPSAAWGAVLGGPSGCPLLHTSLRPVVRAASVTRELSHPRLLTHLPPLTLAPQP